MSAPLFTLGQALAWLPGARLSGDPATPVLRVSTDTRDVRAGDLFVALRGERFDAHGFVAQARAAGAVATVQQLPAAAGETALVVPDTRRALGALAAGWRRALGVPVIAVTGSNGKTTVKEMIAAILRAHAGDAAAFATPGNLNNDVGVPLSLLALRARHRVAVIELGMNHPGEIAALAAMAAPQVALVNNAQREHQEFLDGTEATARENGAVFGALADGGIAVHPGDDPRHTPIWDALAPAHAHLRFGLRDAGHDGPAAAPLRAWADITSRPAGFVLHLDDVAVPVALSIAGRHNVRNALAAAACCHALGVAPQAIARGLAAFRPVDGRLRQFHDLPGAAAGTVLVDDTYNANPDSVLAAIDVLADEAGPQLLVLGDMGEVGDDGAAFHREVGEHAARRGIAHVLALGALSVAAVDAARDAHAAGAPGAADARHFDAVEPLAAAARALLPQCRAVLVKGSRFMRMERVVHALTGRPAGQGAH